MTQQDTLDAVIARTSQYLEATRDDPLELTGNSAISQDALIMGIDVDDYVAFLSKEFGEIVWQIPWLLYTDQTSSFRGCATVLVPFWMVGRIIWWAAGRSSVILPRPNPKEFPYRLELRHIAKVIEDGEWSEP